MAIALTVDNRRIEVGPGASVLDAVNATGAFLPQLCKDADRPRIGACRTCLVSIEGMRGTPAACSVPAADGMVVRTDTPEVERVRRGVLQLTLDMLPEDDTADLRELGVAARGHGLVPGRFRPAAAIPVRQTEDVSNPVWLLDRTRCILCQRCLDACQEVQHISAIALLGASRDAEIGVFAHGALIDSNCTSCGQCWATCPTGAIRLKAPVSQPSANGQAMPPASLRHGHASVAVGATHPFDAALWQEVDTRLPRGDGFPKIERRVETTCPYCGVGCGIVLNLGERGEIVQVDDVPHNLSSRGRLCVKGRFGLGFVHSPERLTTPLVRDRRDEPFRPATWEEALERAAEGLARHRGRVGVVGSAKATCEDGFVIQKFARAILGTNNIDHCTRLCHSSSVTAMMEMLGSGNTSNSYEDFERAGCLMVVGSDTDVNHPVIAARVRTGVVEHGAALIVVNPRRIGLCDVADLWLRPRPGTDVALFNAMARIALDEGLWDESFVRNRTEGFEAWRTSLAPYTDETVAELTGIPAADFRRAARLFARPAHGHSSMLWGMGSTQHTRGVANVMSMLNLVLLTGQIGKPGSGIAPLRGQNNVQGCSDVGVLPDHLPGYQGLGLEARTRFGRIWSVDVPETPGLKLTEMVEAAGRGEMKALYLAGENPLLSEPNLHHAAEALARLEFIVLQLPLPNEMMELADIVLPASIFAEKDGTFINSERRVQMVRKALEPPGDARADWEITCDLARRVASRLAQPAGGFDYACTAEIFEEMAALMPILGGLSHARLQAGGIQWPCPTADHPGTPILFADDFPRGKGRFVPVDQAVPVAERTDRRFPLLLNTGRVLHWHGGDMTRRVESLVSLYPEVEISLHPADAAAHGIGDGEQVQVASRRGEIVAKAHVTTDQTRGEVFIPFVQLKGAAANLLTNDVFDPRSRIPEFKACAVRVAPAHAPHN